jgi:hypothetical protein
LKKNHTAEEMANGKVGSQNQYERYFSGSKTLNEQPILRGRRFGGDVVRRATRLKTLKGTTNTP